MIYKHFTFSRRGCASGPCFGFHVARLRSSAHGQTAPDSPRRDVSLGGREKMPAAPRRGRAESGGGWYEGREVPSAWPQGRPRKRREAKGGKQGAGGDPEGSAFRAFIDLRAETSAILLAFRSLMTQPVGQSGSGQEDEGGNLEDENHGRHGVSGGRTLRSWDK